MAVSPYHSPCSMSNTSDTFQYEVDTSGIEALMEELNPKQLRAAWKSGLRPSAKMIERGVIAELEAEHPNAAKYKGELATQIWKKGGGYTVSLSGRTLQFTTKKGKVVEGNHLYILRWLAKGTQERHTKSGAYRGRVVGSHFFKHAVDKTIEPAMQRIATDVQKSMERAVKRAAAKAAKNSGQPL